MASQVRQMDGFACVDKLSESLQQNGRVGTCRKTACKQKLHNSVLAMCLLKTATRKNGELAAPAGNILVWR